MKELNMITRHEKLGNFKYGDLFMNIIIFSTVIIFSLLCILPFWYVLTYSITPYSDFLKEPMNLLPRNITFSAYKQVLGYPLIKSGFKNSVFITLIGTALQMLLLSITAYPLSKRNLRGGKFVLLLFVFTMFFNGGIIPNYYLIRSLGLINSLWALILPSLIGAYPLILMRNFIKAIPDSLEESAIIDGANDIQTLFLIILPLSVPALATLAIFYAVGEWNQFFSAIIYITKRSKWPLQLVLRELVIENNLAEIDIIDESRYIFPYNLKMATIMVTIVPIMCVYPFAQKYFMHGLLLGAVKG